MENDYALFNTILIVEAHIEHYRNYSWCMVALWVITMPEPGAMLTEQQAWLQCSNGHYIYIYYGVNMQ